MTKSPHRLSHVEHHPGPRKLSSFDKGEVVIRHGAPCMVVEVATPHPEPNRTYLVNLLTGAAWTPSEDEEVWPATEVHLTCTTMRMY